MVLILLSVDLFSRLWSTFAVATARTMKGATEFLKNCRTFGVTTGRLGS